VVKGSGQQKLTLVGWSTEVHEGGCPVNPGPTVPSGISLMYVGFEYSGFTNGEDVAWQWLISGEPWYQESTYNSEGWKFNESGDCFPIPGTWEDGRRLPDGQYRVIVYAGETLRLIADESVEVGGDAVPPPEEGVLIAARVVDQDSRQPIAGAVVVFLEPGTDPKAWREEVPQDRTKVVATSAKTTTAGHVAFDNPLEPGVAYPWVIEMPEGTTGYGPWYYKTNGYLVPELNVNVDFSVFKRP
jgi:hypothetical protein